MTVAEFPDGRPLAGGRARAALERVPPLPDRRRVAASSRWWMTSGLGKLFALAVRAPLLLLCELRPIAVGAARLVGGWARWCDAADYAARVDAARVAGEVDKRDADRVESRRERRRLLSGLLFVAAAVAVLVAAARWPQWLAVAGIVAVLVCDAVGRRVAGPPAVNLPPPARAVLTEGVPLTQVTRTLVDRAAERWGISLGIARAMTYSPSRREYELWVTSAEPLTAEHCRDFERAVGATDHSIRVLAPPDRNSSVRRLVIREGDPLAELVPRPFFPTGSRSILEPLPLGVSLTDVPFEVDFTQHLRIVAGTGGGKTKWFLRAAIDVVSSCRDAVCMGADITRGPEMTLWRDVLQRKAHTPEDVDALFDFILAEIERRAAILDEIAADDDPTNDADEWHPGLGPFWVVFLDEYPQIAAYDGKSGRLNLLGKAEQIIRTSRKFGIFCVLFAQKTGNDDFGSTVMSSQCGGTILGPCDPADTVRMVGADRRDQGYTPHLFVRGTADQPNDAGKCFLDTPRHTTPDPYRAFAPGSNSEVKRRALQRMADGLPPLVGGRSDVDAVEVPAVLAEVERAFAAAGWPDRMATADLVDRLRTAGQQIDERGLAERLRPHRVRPDARWRPAKDANAVRGYYLADVRSAIGRLS